MSEEQAQAAARAQAQALVDGDFGAAIRRMTPDGLARAMTVGNTTWTVTGYDVARLGREGDDYLFAVTLQTDLGPLFLRERFRESDGEWKMVDIERVSG